MTQARPTIVSPAQVAIENLGRVAEALGEAAVPIYNPTKKGLAQLVGTGFYLEAGDATFFVTAAHVGDLNAEGSLHVSSVGAELKELADGVDGEPLRTVVPEGGARDEDDSFDLTVIPIKSGWPDPYYYRIPVGRTVPNDPGDPSSRYVVQGFPGTKNRVQPGSRRIKRRLFSHAAAPADATHLAKVPRDPAFFVGVPFDPKKSYHPARAARGEGAIAKPPKPNGISGGPIWSVPPSTLLDGDPERAGLAGVCLELHAHAGVIVGVRIGLALAVIAELRPDLAPLLPERRLGEFHVRRADRG